MKDFAGVRRSLELLFDVGLLKRLSIAEDLSEIEMTVKVYGRLKLEALGQLVEELTGRKYSVESVKIGVGYVEVRFEGGWEK